MDGYCVYELWVVAAGDKVAQEVEGTGRVVIEAVALSAERHDSLGALTGLEAARVDMGRVDRDFESISTTDDARQSLDLVLLGWGGREASAPIQD